MPSPKGRRPAPRPRVKPVSKRARQRRRGSSWSGPSTTVSTPYPSFPPASTSHRTRAFVDLQNDVTDEGSGARREGRLPLGRARQALHDDRHGHRPGQDRQPQCLRLPRQGARPDHPGDRHHHLPPALQAGDLRRDRRPARRARSMRHAGRRRCTTGTVDRGAIFEPVGDWLRARDLSQGGRDVSTRPSSARRSPPARAIGVLDASTLGKIDVKGQDAREFLNRVYTNAWSKLAPGRCRYGLMLGEDGMVIDDGVTACLADDHFHMTTTTGGAARVLGRLEDYLQTEWTDLKVYLTSVTEQWAVASLCGPDCERIVAQLCDDLDVSEAALPFMSLQEAHDRRPAGARVPHLLHRRAFLRDQHPRLLRPLALGEDPRGGKIAGISDALRHGGHASAPRREGLHHRRPGDRRHRHAARLAAWTAWSR